MPAKTSRSKLKTVPHLPQPWSDQGAYDDLFRKVIPYDDYSEADSPWQEIRIPRGASAEDVFRLLPSHLDFEYGGYLTKTRIRYVACEPHHAWVPKSKACTFHSHPTKIQNTAPELPSVSDIRSFLLGRHWRTITVGRFDLWVWDKTDQTLEVVRRLHKWESNNMVKAVRRLEEEFPGTWEREFMELAPRKIGLTVPRDNRRWSKVWQQRLEDKLGLQVTVHKREC